MNKENKRMRSTLTTEKLREITKAICDDGRLADIYTEPLNEHQSFLVIVLSNPDQIHKILVDKGISGSLIKLLAKFSRWIIKKTNS